MALTKIGSCQFLIISSWEKTNSKKDKAFFTHPYIRVKQQEKDENRKMQFMVKRTTIASTDCASSFVKIYFSKAASFQKELGKHPASAQCKKRKGGKNKKANQAQLHNSNC